MRTSRAGGRDALWVLIGALALGCAAGGPAVPEPGGTVLADRLSAGDFSGVWVGSYLCAQGPTGLRLTVRLVAPGRFEGRFDFFPLAENPGVPEGSFELRGDGAGGRLVLAAGDWIRQPEGYQTVGLVGNLSDDSRSLTGEIDHPSCTTFAVTRAESGLE